MGLKSYIVNVLIALDVVVSVLIGGAQAETLSSTSYRKHRDGAFWGFLCPAINWLMRDPNHCWESYLTDRSRTFPK